VFWFIASLKKPFFSKAGLHTIRNDSPVVTETWGFRKSDSRAGSASSNDGEPVFPLPNFFEPLAKVKMISAAAETELMVI
jgi:hypothetical protein